MHRKRAYVTTGEKYRRDNIGVSCHCHSATGYGALRRIIESIEYGIIKSRQKYLFDETCRHATTATVTQADDLVVALRCRTADGEWHALGLINHIYDYAPRLFAP